MPAIKPTLNLNFANSRQLGPLVTFTRASTATRINGDGFLETVPSDAPRFDFDPVTLNCRGLLVEESRTNICLHSNTFSDAVWAKTTGGTGVAAVLTANAGISPDGTNNAWRLQCNTGVGGTANDRSHLIQSFTGLANPHASSLFLWIKSNTGLNQNIYFRNATGTGTVSVNGVATGVSAASPVVITPTWQLFSVVQPTQSLTTDQIQVGCRGTVGDQTCDILIYGGQFEVAAFPLSYIPTAGSQVTRAADIAVISGTNFTNWFRADEGSLVCKFIQAQQAQTQFGAYISDGSATKYIAIRTGFNAGTSTTFAVLDTATQAAPSLVNQAIGLKNTAAVSYATDNFLLALNGRVTAPDTSGSVPSGMNQMRLGSGLIAGSERLNGWLENLTYYPARLTNAELQALTS
jgi:hypothetical protein